jgi:Uma2 family endonuclease
MAGWRRERMPEIPNGVAFELAPDCVCEVLSPGTAAIDRSSKRRIYAREGVRWLWLVEPETKTLETFALDGPDWKHLETWHDDAVVRAVPFDAIELELAALWRA